MVATFEVPMAQRLKRGLVAYWPTASAGAVDLKSALYDGRGPYDLTNNNSVTRGAGPSNNLPDAAEFVGSSSQYLSAADAPGFAFGSVPFTVGVWAYLDSAVGLATFQSLITQDDVGEPDRAFGLYYAASTQRFVWELSTDGSTTTQVTANTLGQPAVDTWYRIICGWDGANGRITINGNRSNIAAFTGPVHNSSETLRLGARSFNGSVSLPLTGRLQSAFVLVGRFLTSSEILWDYNNGAGRDWARGV